MTDTPLLKPAESRFIPCAYCRDSAFCSHHGCCIDVFTQHYSDQVDRLVPRHTPAWDGIDRRAKREAMTERRKKDVCKHGWEACAECKFGHYNIEAPPPPPRAKAPLGLSIPFSSAADFCAEASRLVGGDRQATHGDKTINFQNIADIWNGYLRVLCRMRGVASTVENILVLDAHDVGCMMELFKVGRRFSGTYNPDDYIDAAGYAGCAGEVAAKAQEKKP